MSWLPISDRMYFCISEFNMHAAYTSSQFSVKEFSATLQNEEFLPYYLVEDFFGVK